MKAAVISSPGVVEVTDVGDPTPGPRDVIVEVAACGLCGTDLHILHGEFAPTLPIVPGHECHYCRRGRDNLCERWAAIGVTVPGGAAQFAKAPVANCVPLPEHVRVEDAALIEPLSCALRGYDVLRAEMAATILIYGAGTMGLMMLELAKRTGASTVDVVDLNPDRLDTARLLGCTSAVTSADELDRPRGWDVVVDATGNERAIQDGLG